MDTIDGYVMEWAAEHVNGVLRMSASPVVIHTVTVTLNGQHGGVDVTMEGEGEHGDAFSVTVAVGR